MLPDYSETKKLFDRFFKTYIRRKARAISPFADIQMRCMHEGRGMRVKRADHSESNSSMQQFSSMIEIRIDEIPDLTFKKVIAKFDALIIDMVRKQTDFTIKRMNEGIPASQSIDAKGKKLDAELFLQFLEVFQLEFYADGLPKELYCVGELFSQERLEALDEEFRNNPKLQKRYDELIAKKKEEWRVREANRKLVG